MKRLFTFLILIIFTIDGFAQRLEEFSANKAEYVSQLETYMTSSKRKLMEDAFKEFNKYFAGGVFTDEEFEQILKTSNLMLKQKMTASPYFLEYLKGLQIVKQAENGEARFKNWHLVLDDMLSSIENRKVKPFSQFLVFSQDFFKRKALKYDEKSGISWYANAEDYTLETAAGIPIIKYDEVDVLGVRKQDTILIIGTSGTFYPLEKIWRGKGGEVSWDRIGLDEEIKAVLGDYEFETSRSLYDVKEVEFYHPELFPDGPIKGSFADKVVSENKGVSVSYPRFESTEKVLRIKNIGGGLNYKGGFRLQGSTVYGYGSKENKAVVALEENGQKVFRGASELFVIRKGERVAGERVETTLYLDADTIYHPSVNVKFDINERHLELARGKRGSDRNPFFNSFNNMNIDSDNIDWYINKDSIIIGKRSISFTKTIKKKAMFESVEYFNEDDYDRIQNISDVNPIAVMKVVAEKEGTRVLDANFLAKKINPRFDVDNVKSLYYDLVSQGFINYDSDNQTVEIKDKVFHYADARQEKVDYDVLKIISETDSTNAVFSLKDKSIRVNGVENVEFSASQKVAAKTVGKQILLKGDRDLEFDGRVFSGFSTFQGKDFYFDYNKFNISMDSVRYFDLFVPTGVEDEATGKKEAMSIASRIEHSTGVLLIDAPSNKSGVEKIEMFPSYQSKGPSYVYYDFDETQDGCYGRDSFYFELDKFSFNSLDNYTKEDLNFKGSMVSHDIFPAFKETLVLQEEDQSLGFVTQTTGSGFSTYLEKGNYKGEVSLSNKGFLGKGNLTYLNASIDSEDIIFKPKQLLCSARNFDLEETRGGDFQTPQAHGDDVSINWRPYRDSMYINSEEAPFALYKANDHTLKGTLILTPDGLKGRGTFDWSKGTFNSKLFSFGPYSANADTTLVKIKALEGENFAFDTRNVKSDVDFDKQLGKFKANAADVVTTMPLNQYQTTLNEFTWDMKGETVTFKSEEGKSGVFTSIHPNQDSLFFDGETAFYDLKSSELQIGGVEYIQTSDAFVYPSDGSVDIQKGGVMTTLNDAKIVANTENKYHVINRATVNVKGKKEYQAQGYYEYNVGDKKQEVFFEDILGTRVGKGKKSEKKSVTRAKGQITEDDKFYIDQKTAYKGDITLNAESKNLKFEGFARLDADGLPYNFWFSINNEADKNDLVINAGEPKGEDGEPIRNGLFLSKESARIYPRVMMPSYYRKDRPIIDTGGHFKYDKEKDQFLFGDSLRVVNQSRRGDLMIFDNKEGTVQTQGTYNLGSGLANGISITAVGQAGTAFNVGQDTSANSYSPVTAEFMAGIMMEIPDKLKKIILNDIKSSSFDSDFIDFTKTKKFYDNATAQWIKDESDYNTALAKMRSGFYELPKKTYDYTMLFSRLPMRWDFDYQSFISTEERIHLGYFDGEPINKYLKCYVEFKMPSNDDDRLYVLIQSQSEYYYFFGYKQGILNLVSNNQKFNDEVAGLKKKENIVKTKEGSYEIQPVNVSTATNFISRVKAARYN